MEREDNSITVNGVKYEFQGRFDKKHDAEDVARIWKSRGYKTMVRKALYPYSGFFIYIEEL